MQSKITFYFVSSFVKKITYPKISIIKLYLAKKTKLYFKWRKFRRVQKSKSLVTILSKYLAYLVTAFCRSNRVINKIKSF